MACLKNLRLMMVRDRVRFHFLAEEGSLVEQSHVAIVNYCMEYGAKRHDDSLH
jgi:hypothetical protein